MIPTDLVIVASVILACICRVRGASLSTVPDNLSLDANGTRATVRANLRHEPAHPGTFPRALTTRVLASAFQPHIPGKRFPKDLTSA